MPVVVSQHLYDFVTKTEADQLGMVTMKPWEPISHPKNLTQKSFKYYHPLHLHYQIKEICVLIKPLEMSTLSLQK